MVRERVHVGYDARHPGRRVARAQRPRTPGRQPEGARHGGSFAAAVGSCRRGSARCRAAGRLGRRICRDTIRGDPVATVDGFLDTFVAQDVAGYAQFLCAEKRDAFVARFDRSGFLGSLPEGVDGGALLAALTMEVADRAVDLVANDGTAASVALRGRFLMRVEDAAAREFIRQFLTEQAMVVTDEMIERTLPESLMAIGGDATSEAGQTFDRVAKLIVEDGLWVICDDEFGFADTESPTAGSPPPSSGPSAVPAPVESAAPSAAG